MTEYHYIIVAKLVKHKHILPNKNQILLTGSASTQQCFGSF
jgi:hypothetical protein